MIVIVGALRASEAAMVTFDNHHNIGVVKNLGKMLFNEFLLPFEIVSLLLLTAMVGAVMLGKKHMKRVKDVAKNKNGRATISTLPVEPVKELTHE